MNKKKCEEKFRAFPCLFIFSRKGAGVVVSNYFGIFLVTIVKKE
jgi:hypothetical protein